MPTSENTFLNSSRVSELWTAIKTALAEKADLSALNDYTTPDAVATAITTALVNYPTNTAVQSAITAALSDYMTASEVNAAIASAVHITFQTVNVLPENGQPNVIYLVPNGGASGNTKDEFIWIDGVYEKIGSTDINLSDYWSKDELRVMTADELQAILT